MIQQHTILILEDDSAYRGYLRILLCRMNYNVIEASNGIQGVDMARKHKPDLILSDFNMPGLNGYQVWEDLQQDEELRQIPFILQSSMVDSRWRNHRHPLLQTLENVSLQNGSTVRLLEKTNTIAALLNALKDSLQEHRGILV